MDPEIAAQRFADQFPAVYRRFYRRIHHSDYRLTDESLALLTHVLGSGPLTMSELARHLDRSQAATSEMIARLERRKLVERTADQRDRRRTLIWLTDAGMEALAMAQQVLDLDLLVQVFEKMTPSDRNRIVAGMDRLLSERIDVAQM